MPKSSYPDSKKIIVGAGIVGFIEAYFAHLEAKKKGERVRITIFEKNEAITDTTTCNIAPSLSVDEIIAVVPRGQEMIAKSLIPFNEPGGIRVNDVPDVNDSPVAERFIRAVEQYGNDEVGHMARTEALLALGRMSMALWQTIYEDADKELKAIFHAANYNPCREPSGTTNALHEGYRIDLIYNIQGAGAKALEMQTVYQKLGYEKCSMLSPDEVVALDSSLIMFCENNSEINESGQRIWNSDAVALWRPAGCLDVRVFIPAFYNYLTTALGTYTTDAGVEKNCFRVKLSRQVIGLFYEDAPMTKTINGLSFFDGRVKFNKHAYQQSDYVLCPGEAVGAVKKLGLNEPAYARFAGVSLKLAIPLTGEQLALYSTFNHCMEVHGEGVVLAWQGRVVDNKVMIAVGGTKAFYADKQPKANEAFAKDRNLLQLNMINQVLPHFMSIALGRDTRGKKLTQCDLDHLEEISIAARWVGTRAVAFDGFPTIGPVYTDGQKVTNARLTTHLGSGGVSFGPVMIAASRFSMFTEQQRDPAIAAFLDKWDSLEGLDRPEDTFNSALTFGVSTR